MAGFWHLSHHQMRDPNGAVYAGARVKFFAADALTPLVVYQDYGLGTEHPDPVVANAYGVFPPVFFDEEDGFYRQRITTSGGVIIPGTDVGTLPIIGPGEGGGGAEVPVDPNALLQTGDPLWVPLSGTRSGFVRMNGRTIGSATSGASERANADTEALFLFYWASFSNTLAPVSGGRGASAAADWSANKTLTLLDMRNKGPFGLPDMGNTNTGEFASTTFDVGDATTAGSQGGDARHTLATTELPAHTHSITDPEHTHGMTNNYGGSGVNAGVNFTAVVTPTGGITAPITNSAATGITATNSTGGGGAHNNMPPFMLGTWYQKL
jgi:microcystin-dependent protein